MKIIKTLLLSLVSGISFIVFTMPDIGNAQSTPAQQPGLSYAAKFVCGTAEETTEAGDVKGVYLTGINIYNPQPQTVRFSKNAVIAHVEGAPSGPISRVVLDTLEPGRAVEVTCQNIRSLFDSQTSLPKKIEGFVIIKVVPDTLELDVWGKYTVRHRVAPGPPMDTDVQSIEIVEIHPKHITFPVPPGP